VSAPLEVPDSGWERRRGRIALEIERAALELFATDGVDEVTTEQIAAAAGISVRSLFRYFPTRADILAALPTRALAELSAQVRERPPEEDLLDALAAARAETLDPERRYFELLWGRVARLSPAPTKLAMAQLSPGLSRTYSGVVAAQLGLPADDPRAGAIGAAVAGVVLLTYRQWIENRGQSLLADAVGQNCEVLRRLGHLDRKANGRARDGSCHQRTGDFVHSGGVRHAAPVPEPVSDPGDRRSARRARTALDIERTALELFATHGVEEVTTEQIAEAAGISLRTLFRHFPTRADILAALPRREIDEMSERLRARPGGGGLFEAFAAGKPPAVDPERRHLELLWGRVVQRSPGPTAQVTAKLSSDLAETCSALLAERMGLPADDPGAGVIGAAVAAVVLFTYRRWVEDEGEPLLADLLAGNLEVLRHLDRPDLARRAVAPETPTTG
jgi:AcrR family transcriptional regulator